jgi:hypothetical protein
MAKRKPTPSDRRARLAAAKAAQARQERRRRTLAVAVVLVVLVALAGGLTALALTDHHGTRSAASATSAPPARSTTPPWSTPPIVVVPALVRAAGLPLLQMEADDVHYHAHLDVIVDGKPVTVPANVGIGATSVSPLHTHDPTGILHVEAPKADRFTLGQFFTEWNVRLTATCIGNLCADNGHQMAFFADGKPHTGDPRQIALAAHEEIAVVYGPAGHLPTPPSSYTFPSGL